jgi:hypothetical protein
VSNAVSVHCVACDVMVFAVCARSIEMVGTGVADYLIAHDIVLGSFWFALCNSLSSSAIAAYVVSPALGIAMTRWLSETRPRYREPWRTVDEGFVCLA